jgi:hypothetical protein
MPHRRQAALDRDHARPRTAPMPASAAMDDRLAELIQPTLFAAGDEYHRLGLRARVLTLPVMVGVVLTMIWRQVASVRTLIELLERERLFLVPHRDFTQQALSLRLRTLPAALFHQVFLALLPTVQARAQARRRPLPAVLTRVEPHFPQVWAIDGSTLEAVFKKVGLLREVPGCILGGTIGGVLDVRTKLPIQVWFDPEVADNDLRWREQIMALVPANTLVLMDAGFYAFSFFDWFTDHDRTFMTPAKANAAFTVKRTLLETPRVRDRVIQLGQYRSAPCRHPLRLLEVQIGTTWHRSLTNVLDPNVLTPRDLVELYAQRWRIEEAFNVTKRLLGLSYLWSGDPNAIALQVWATWMLYAVLVDLSDAVAEELDQPLERISLERTYRSLYHFATAFAAGAAVDPVAYLASDPTLVLIPPRPKRDQRRLDAWPPELNL